MSKQKSVFIIFLCGLVCVMLSLVGGVLTSSNKRVAFAEEGATTEPAKYTIIYKNTVDSFEIITDNPASVTLAELSLDLSSPTPQTGYVFSYWGFNKNAPLPSNKDNCYVLTKEDVDDYATGTEIVLYAFWDFQNYDLTFEYSGVEYGSVRDATGFADLENKVTVISDIDLTNEIYQPNCAGHQFVGWYTDSAYSVAITRLNNVTSDTKLYGKFSKLDYRVTFADTSLGFDSIPFRSGMDYAFDYNGQKGLLSMLNPQKEGYHFAGWYTTEDCREGTQVGKFYIFTTPVTLYAKWEKRPSAVWLYAFGGSCVVIAGGFVAWYYISKRKLRYY